MPILTGFKINNFSYNNPRLTFISKVLFTIEFALSRTKLNITLYFVGDDICH